MGPVRIQGNSRVIYKQYRRGDIMCQGSGDRKHFGIGYTNGEEVNHAPCDYFASPPSLDRFEFIPNNCLIDCAAGKSSWSASHSLPSKWLHGIELKSHRNNCSEAIRRSHHDFRKTDGSPVDLVGSSTLRHFISALFVPWII